MKRFISFSDELRRSQSAGGTNSKQYWAKGTGFGTGSTSSGWDIEQALVKQKNEEEHITWILQVRVGNFFLRNIVTCSSCFLIKPAKKEDKGQSTPNRIKNFILNYF